MPARLCASLQNTHIPNRTQYHGPSVSVAAEALQAAGFITYHRGEVTVLHRSGLEAASCECHRLIRERFDRLAGGSDADSGGR